MKYEDLRPCIVEGRAARFHRFFMTTQPQSYFMTTERIDEYETNDLLYAIVEFEDGHVKEILIEREDDLKFTDHNKEETEE